jgi:hypothetical protein
MSTVLDLLNEPEFADDELTEAINIPPYETGRLAQLGLFTDTPIATTYARLLINEGAITIIPARERGGPSNKNMGGGEKEALIRIPHFPLDDAITPSMLQNVYAWGAARVKQTLEGVVNDKLLDIRAKHDATHSHLDWGALNGLILDGENKELANLWDIFDIAQPTMSVALASESTDIAAKNRELKSKIKANLKGARFSGVRVFAGPEFFDKYVGHGDVKDAYRYYALAGQKNPSRDDIGDGFDHAGIIIERVDEEFSVRRADNSFQARPAVASDEAVAVPFGTPYFKRYIAPPDTIFDANRAPAVESKIFVSTDDLPHGKGKDVHTESNVLPICQRPQLMVKLTIG